MMRARSLLAEAVYVVSGKPMDKIMTCDEAFEEEEKAAFESLREAQFSANVLEFNDDENEAESESERDVENGLRKRRMMRMLCIRLMMIKIWRTMKMWSKNAMMMWTMREALALAITMRTH